MRRLLQALISNVVARDWRSGRGLKTSELYGYRTAIIISGEVVSELQI
jgi:hypothetical protein